MNQIKKFFTIQALLIVVVLLMPALVHAQGPGGGNTPGDPDSAPIDGGLSLLIAAGVGYGAKKLRTQRKKQQDENEKC